MKATIITVERHLVLEERELKIHTFLNGDVYVLWSEWEGYGHITKNTKEYVKFCNVLFREWRQ